MRAIVVRQFGGLEAAELASLPYPRIAPHEVLVRIEAVAVNFVDIVVISGKYQFCPELPFVPGKLPVGTVEAVGAEVTSLKVDDRVQTLAELGGFAEFIAVPASQCLPLPLRLGFPEAAAMALAYDTAWFALRDRARLAPGETALVLGATGAVGLAAIQLAKAMGATVLAAVSAPEKAERARQAGADGIVDISVANLRDELRANVLAQTDGAGVDVILDPLGGDIFDAAIRALAWRGRLVVIGFASGRIPEIKANYLLVKNIEVSGLQVSDYRKRDPEAMRTCFKEVYALWEAGRLQPGLLETLPLENAREALRLVAERKARGRVILLPGERVERLGDAPRPQ
jgi:NADPH:quinone reductase